MQGYTHVSTERFCNELANRHIRKREFAHVSKETHFKQVTPTRIIGINNALLSQFGSGRSISILHESNKKTVQSCRVRGLEINTDLVGALFTDIIGTRLSVFCLYLNGEAINFDLPVENNIGSLDEMAGVNLFL